MSDNITEASGNLANKDAQPKEIRQSQSRIVVFGSRVSGAANFSQDFTNLLEKRGIEHVEVEWYREAPHIKTSFFGLAPGEPFSDPKASLPRGVVVFPELRQYHNGMGMSIRTHFAKGLDDKTPYDHIKELCDKFGVPCVRMEEEDSLDLPSLESKMKALISPLEKLLSPEETQK